jgi:hypothetical protein
MVAFEKRMASIPTVNLSKIKSANGCQDITGWRKIEDKPGKVMHYEELPGLKEEIVCNGLKELEEGSWDIFHYKAFLKGKKMLDLDSIYGTSNFAVSPDSNYFLIGACTFVNEHDAGYTWYVLDLKTRKTKVLTKCTDCSRGQFSDDSNFILLSYLGEYALVSRFDVPKTMEHYIFKIPGPWLPFNTEKKGDEYWIMYTKSEDDTACFTAKVKI